MTRCRADGGDATGAWRHGGCGGGRGHPGCRRRAAGRVSNEANPETWGNPAANDPCPCGSGESSSIVTGSWRNRQTWLICVWKGAARPPLCI